MIDKMDKYTYEDDKLPEEAEQQKASEPELTREKALEDEVNHLKDQWLRALAELENLRKRSEREREDIRKYACAEFAREMLTIRDNLRRALESCPQAHDLSDAVKALISGVELTEKELLSAFQQQGIHVLNPLGERFDPNFHQAMLEIEDATKSAGTVAQVLQVGYRLHDRLLRPALVAVTKDPVGSKFGS